MYITPQNHAPDNNIYLLLFHTQTDGNFYSTLNFKQKLFDFETVERGRHIIIILVLLS